MRFRIPDARRSLEVPDRVLAELAEQPPEVARQFLGVLEAIATAPLPPRPRLRYVAHPWATWAQRRGIDGNADMVAWAAAEEG